MKISVQQISSEFDVVVRVVPPLPAYYKAFTQCQCKTPGQNDGGHTCWAHHDCMRDQDCTHMDGDE
jgi:hypothetical protein